MPTVSTYGARKIGTNPLQGGKLSSTETLESTGANYQDVVAQSAEKVGRANVQKLDAIAGLGETVAHVGLQLGAQHMRDVKEQRDKAEASAHATIQVEAQNKLSWWVNNQVEDPTSGALSVVGKDVLVLPDQVRGVLDTKVAEIASTIQDPLDRAAFQRHAMQTLVGVDSTVMRHVDSQMKQFNAGELDAKLKNVLQDAAVAASDPTRLPDLAANVSTSLKSGLDAIDAMAPGLGLGPQKVQEQKDALQSQAHAAVVNQLLASNQVGAAKEYFDEAKDHISATTKATLTKALASGDTRVQAQDTFDKIIAEGGTPAQQLEKARTISRKDDPTGEVRDQVENRLKIQHAYDEHAATEVENQTLNQSYNLIESGKSVADVERIVGTEKFDKLGAHKAAMKDRSIRIAKGEPRVTNEVRRYELMQMARDHPQQFATWPMNKEMGALDKSDFEQMANLQLSLSNGNKGASDKVLAGIRTSDDIFQETMWQHTHTLPKDYTTEQRDLAAQLHRSWDNDVNADQANGVKVNTADQQRKLDDIIARQKTVPEKKHIFFANEPAHLAPITIDDISPAEQATLKRALQQRGRPVTTQSIIDAHIAQMGVQ